MEQLSCYYSVFESINRNCIAIHGTIDEICNSLAVIDIEDFIVEVIEMTERFMKEFNIKYIEILKKKCEVVLLLFDIMKDIIVMNFNQA